MKRNSKIRDSLFNVFFLMMDCGYNLSSILFRKVLWNMGTFTAYRICKSVETPAFDFVISRFINLVLWTLHGLYLIGTRAANKVVSRSASVGDGASIFTISVEDDSVSARRATSVDAVAPVYMSESLLHVTNHIW